VSTSLRSQLAQRPLLLFLPLAFLLSWYPSILMLLGVEASGINPLGPLVAALIVLGLTAGWPGVRALLAGIVKLRAGLRWYAVALLLPAAMVGLAAAVVLAFGAPMPPPEQLAPGPEQLDRALFALLFVSLGEEPGWRGFLLPLLRRRRALLSASLALGGIWTLWHLPVMVVEFPPVVIPAFALNVMAASVVLAWLYERSGGSTFLCMLMHAVVNTVGAGWVFSWFADGHQVALWWVYTALWVGLACVVASRMGRPEDAAP
jgi:uncharacterized protein